MRYFRFPPLLAALTLWDHCTEWRFDYFIALSQIFLLCLLFRNGNESLFKYFRRENFFLKILSIFLASVSIFLPLLSLLRVPDIYWNMLKNNTLQLDLPQTVLLIFLLYVILGILMFFKFRWVAICLLLFELHCGVSYNPLGIAPYAISSPLLEKVKTEKGSWRHEGRVLFISTTSEGNLYAAAGGKSLNGFFHYEDVKIFDLLLKDLPKSDQFHRLNHMIAEITSASAPVFGAYVPQADVIRVKFNGVLFDFSKLPIDYVLAASRADILLLDRNPSLAARDSFGLWKRYYVVSPENRK